MIALSFASLALAAIASAPTDDSTSRQSSATGPVYVGSQGQLDVAIPRLETSIVVDGKLDDAAWRSAAMLTGFSQFAPQDGRPAADSTQVLVWYSPSAIHFGIRTLLNGTRISTSYP